MFKKKVRSGRAAQLDDVFVDGPKTQVGDCSVIEDDGHATPYIEAYSSTICQDAKKAKERKEKGLN